MRRTLRELRAPALHTVRSLYFTRDPLASRWLRHEAALRRRSGFQARWLDAPAVRRVGGFEAAGGILSQGNAQVDPYRSCLAFVRGARAEGARFFERSEVRRIDGLRDGVTLTLRHGRIHADWAVIATGYATPAFERLTARFRMMNTYVIATPRLTAAQRRRVGLPEIMLWDTERPYHYVRWTTDGRLLFGGRDRARVPRATRASTLRRRAAELMNDLVALFPSLDGMQPEYAWEGLFANTPDGLPYIGSHRHYPRQLFALGYGGNGMTFGYLAAEMLVRHTRGAPSHDDRLFAFSRGR